jgi:hypothetical protein
VPLTLITKDPFDPDDVLSPVALPDTDFKMSERSLITVIDSDSTLLNIKVDKKRKHVEKEQTWETRPKVAPPPPHSSDATISPGRVEEVASVIIRTHPRIGSGYDEWFRTLCAICNEAGRHPEVVLLTVEYSSIREGYRGASDVEGSLSGLQLRESGAKVTMASLVKWANENPALVFNMIENSSGLGPVEGVGANKLWVKKFDQMLRWTDTARTSFKWVVKCGSYLAPSAEIQIRSWVQQHYPQVSDEEFKTIWCLQTRSEYYENALKKYIISALEEIGGPQCKRARRASDSDRSGAGSQPKAVSTGPKAVSSHSGVGDGRGVGAGYKSAGASSKQYTENQDSPFCTEGDMSSSSGTEPVVQDSEQTQTVQDAVPTFQHSDAMVQGSDDMVQDSDAMVQDSGAMVQDSGAMVQDSDAMVQDSDLIVQECTPPASDAALTEAAATTSSSIAALGPRKPPSPVPSTAAARPSPVAAAITCEDEGSEDLNEEDGGSEDLDEDEGSHDLHGYEGYEDQIDECEFDNLSEENLSKITRRMNVKCLNADDIDPHKDLTVQSAYKTQKTRMVHAYVKKNNLSIISIANLCSLSDGFLETFADCNVLSYKNKKRFRKEFTAGRSVSITLNSLWLLEQVPFRAQDYVVFLDEIHSVINYLASSTTLSANRRRIWTLLVRILSNCKQYIAVDNDIGDAEIEFLTKVVKRDHTCEFWMNSYESYGGVRATEVPTMDGMEVIQNRILLDGEYFLMCFNEKGQAEKVNQSLKTMCEKEGKDPALVRLFTSKEGGRITNIEEQFCNHYVAYSPVIVTGLSFNPSVPTVTFCYVKGTQSLSPEECVQQLARNRNMSRLYYHLENVAPVKPRFKTEEDIKECYREERGAMQRMAAYHEVCDRRLSTCGDAYESEGNVFTDIVSKVEYRRHLMECAFRHHFVKILTKTGFQVEESDKIAVGYGTKKRELLERLVLEDRDRKKEAFIEKCGTGLYVRGAAGDEASNDDVFEADARRRADFLHLPLEEQVIRDYKDEVFEDKVFQQHLNTRSLTRSKESVSEKINAAVNGDCSLNAPQTDASRVVMVCQLFRMCVPDLSSVLELQVSVGAKDEVPIPEDVLGLWRLLNGFRKGDRRKVPTNKKKLIQSLANTAKKLFGNDYLDVTYPQTRSEGKKHNETCYTVNPEWRERHMKLFRYSAHAQRGGLDSEIARRYDLFPAHDDEPVVQPAPLVQGCEPGDCSNALATRNALLRAQGEAERVEQRRLQGMRSKYKSLGIEPNF